MSSRSTDSPSYTAAMKRASSAPSSSNKKMKMIVLSSDDEDFKEPTPSSASVAQEQDDVSDDGLDPAELDSDDMDIIAPAKPKPVKRKKISVQRVVVEEDREDDDKTKKEKKKASPEKAKKDKKKKDDGGKNTRVVPVLKADYEMPTEPFNSPRVLESTWEFLRQLALPGNNVERDWFKARDPWFRHAEKNWIAFINALVPIAMKADWSLPALPATDLVHRIYRDIKFSKDKTPYKTNFAASLSRTGRKSSFAMYYIHVQPGGKTTIAAGCWAPSAPDIATIRRSILQNPAPLRKVISAPAFVKLFGPPHPDENGKRNSLWGQGDELKNAPKIEGVKKDHKDIDLLKLKTIAVSMRIKDKVAKSPEFLETIYEIFTVLAPFVQCLNEMILPTPQEDSGEEEEIASSEEGNGNGNEGNDDGSEDE